MRIDRARTVDDLLRTTSFYDWRGRSTSEELLQRQVEHHLRREAWFVERFIADPTTSTLHAGARLRLGVC